MSYDNDQNEQALPADGKSNRKSETLLPRFFRTTPNKKFLNSTLDQLIQPGVVEKLNGYIGRETAKAYTATDNYVGDVSDSRFNYQLEPAAVIKDNLDNVTFYKDYNDFVNQLNNFNKTNDNHSVFNQQEYYAWNPNVDWDKFSNFREYYWLPLGPQTIGIAGNSIDVESTYTVRIGDNVDNETYVFSPDGLTQNPTITLYRGITYNFGLNYCNHSSTIGIAITNKKINNLDSFHSYFTGLCSIALDSISLNSICQDEKYNYIEINCQLKEGLKFGITKEGVEELLNEGEVFAEKYYSNFISKIVIDYIIDDIISIVISTDISENTTEVINENMNENMNENVTENISEDISTDSVMSADKSIENISSSP